MIVGIEYVRLTEDDARAVSRASIPAFPRVRYRDPLALHIPRPVMALDFGPSIPIVPIRIDVLGDPVPATRRCGDRGAARRASECSLWRDQLVRTCDTGFGRLTKPSSAAAKVRQPQDRC